MTSHLDVILNPVTRYLEGGINEIMINEPGSIWVEKSGVCTEYKDEELHLGRLMGIAQQIASFAQQELSENKPILSASLPSGERVQVVIPAALEQGKIAISIRKPNPLTLSLGQMKDAGTFANVVFSKGGLSDLDRHLLELQKDGDTMGFLSAAVKGKKNIIISGGTSSGKTTLANALVQEIPLDERIITIEDTREARLPHRNKLHLLASSGNQGLADVTFADLLKSCLRLNPSRILMSELRGTEAFDFLRGVNSGHPGAITTMHADSPKGAVFQLALMVLQAGVNLTQEQIENYILSIVDIIVQKQNINGNRVVTEIYYDPERKNITEE